MLLSYQLIVYLSLKKKEEGKLIIILDSIQKIILKLAYNLNTTQIQSLDIIENNIQMGSYTLLF